MTLSAEALEIIDYLKTDPGRFVSLLEISRRAGGRRRFEESRSWARNLMSSLLDAGLIEVNPRGHYRVTLDAQSQVKPHPPAQPASPNPCKAQGKVIADDYFPTNNGLRIIDGDYFPTTD
jgi:hypothetical protein